MAVEIASVAPVLEQVLALSALGDLMNSYALHGMLHFQAQPHLLTLRTPIL